MSEGGVTFTFRLHQPEQADGYCVEQAQFPLAAVTAAKVMDFRAIANQFREPASLLADLTKKGRAKRGPAFGGASFLRGKPAVSESPDQYFTSPGSRAVRP